jgi:hypothetical protein
MSCSDAVGRGGCGEEGQEGIVTEAGLGDSLDEAVTQEGVEARGTGAEVVVALGNHRPRRSRPEIPDVLRMGTRLLETEHDEDIEGGAEAAIHGGGA